MLNTKHIDSVVARGDQQFFVLPMREVIGEGVEQVN
jgi:hypothetical protein